jgi:hypothetical protein
MSLPEFIEANNIPTGNGVPSGIITALKSKVSNVLSYVVPTSNTAADSGDVTNIVTWNGGFTTQDNTEAYVQVEFKDRYVLATHYSLKSYSIYGYCFAKEWYLYGFDSVGETPTLITTNTSEGSTFCGTDSYCSSNDWATFTIPNSSIPYRFLRFQIKKSTCTVWRVSLSGFEVFGVYSKDKSLFQKKKVFKSCQVCSHFPIHILFKAILICS